MPGKREGSRGRGESGARPVLEKKGGREAAMCDLPPRRACRASAPGRPRSAKGRPSPGGGRGRRCAARDEEKPTRAGGGPGARINARVSTGGRASPAAPSDARCGEGIRIRPVHWLIEQGMDGGRPHYTPPLFFFSRSRRPKCEASHALPPSHSFFFLLSCARPRALPLLGCAASKPARQHTPLRWGLTATRQTSEQGAPPGRGGRAERRECAARRAPPPHFLGLAGRRAPAPHAGPRVPTRAGGWRARGPAGLGRSGSPVPPFRAPSPRTSPHPVSLPPLNAGDLLFFALSHRRAFSTHTHRHHTNTARLTHGHLSSHAQQLG